MFISPAAIPARENAPLADAVLDGLALYASAIDASDYVARVAPEVRRLAPDTGALIDVGAGGGQLGAALRSPDHGWTAVEPSPVMQARLAARAAPPAIVPQTWQNATASLAPADTVLAATMPGYFGDAPAFLGWCRNLARQRVIWIVPAQQGPHGLILAGCLPREWHQEDETPGVDLVLPQLGSDAPDQMTIVDWTFSLVTPDLPRLAAWMADRLGWPADDARCPALRNHLADQAVATPAGLRLSCSRRSAILIWNS